MLHIALTIVSLMMVYRVGSWKDVFDLEYPAGLDRVDDDAFLLTKKDTDGHIALNNLLPHQIDAAVFLASRSGATLADDMGLGKTRSTLASLRLSPKTKLPAVIITPAGLRKTWEKEVEKYWPDCSVVLADKPTDLEAQHDIGSYLIPS